MVDYHIIKDQPDYKLSEPYEKLVREVCRIMINCDFLTPTHRANYGQIGELPATVTEKNGDRTYSYGAGNVYTKSSYLMAFCEAAFPECPALGELKRGKYVANEVGERFNRAGAYEAFCFFFQSFGESPHQEAQLSELLQTDQLFKALEMVNSVKPN